MKKAIVIVGLLFLAGCAMYQDDIKKAMTDPVYADYVSQKEELEGQYLEGTITYAVYLQSLRELDNEYEKQTKERSRKLQENQ
jgi:hypothetical protein